MAKNKKPTIALCMICKDNESTIVRALDSTKGVFDGYFAVDTGSKDMTVAVFQEWCEQRGKGYNVSEKKIGKDYKAVKVDGKKVLGDFASARNDSFELAKGYDYIFWMDTDDVLINPEGIPLIVKNMEDEGLDIALMTYIYGKDQHGVPVVKQKRERIINMAREGEWRKRVHESYKYKEHNPKHIFIEDVWLEHERTAQESVTTNRRNKLIMNEMLKEDGIDKIDEDVLINIAFDHWEHREYEDAIKFYQAFIDRKKNGLMANEGFQVASKMAKAYLGLAKIEDAIIHALRATKFMPLRSEGYLLLSECYSLLAKWQEVLFYSERAIKCEKPNSIEPVSDVDYLVTPRRFKVTALMSLGRVDEAWAVCKELLKIVPSVEHRDQKNKVESELLRQKAIYAINDLLKYLQNHNRADFADRLRSAIPTTLLDDPTVRQMIKEMMYDNKRKTTNIKLKGEKSIVIYTGDFFEHWDGNSAKTEGIGGSEGMAILLARGLAKLDNKVFIYGNPKEEKEIDGVIYKNHQKYNHQLKSDVFISLRRPDIFNGLIASKKQYLWLHDTDYGDIPIINFYAPNKVIVLSEAHREVLKENYSIKDDSIFWVTRNALNDFALTEADKDNTPRNEHQMIYASSYDRGLDNVLKIWPRITKAIPDANLRIYYGWGTYDAIMNARQSQKMLEFKKGMIEMISQSEGVQELGRVTQVELYKQFKQSGVWFYPTEFYEISCINAMTAQAMGTIPVCTPFAALNETVNTKLGAKYTLDRITDGLIEVLSNNQDKRRKKLSKWARDKFDIDSLAKEWDTFFNND